MLSAYDIDGVIAQQTLQFNLIAERDHGQPIVEPTYYEWYEEWNDPAIFKLLLNCEEIWTDMLPYEGALEHIQEVQAAGISTVFITFRPEIAYPHTTTWLEKFGFPTNVEFSSQKHLIAKGLGVDVAIDDYALMVERYLDFGIEAYLMDRPWNDNVTHLPKVDLDEYSKILRSK